MGPYGRAIRVPYGPWPHPRAALWIRRRGIRSLLPLLALAVVALAGGLAAVWTLRGWAPEISWVWYVLLGAVIAAVLGWLLDRKQALPAA